jgi:hypothetical protein
MYQGVANPVFEFMSRQSYFALDPRTRAGVDCSPPNEISRRVHHALPTPLGKARSSYP